MIPVGMMKMSVNQVIDMVAMRNGLVTAVGAMLVRLVMASALVGRGAVGRVLGVDRDLVFLDAILGHVVQMAIVEVIGVTVMLNGGVTAIRSVLVVMVFVMMMVCQDQSPSSLTAGGLTSSSAACARALETRSTTCRSESS